MTLTNSCCWPNSFSHLIVLLSTLAITISTPNHLYHEQTVATSHQPQATTTGAIYDRRSDNKRYDNLFDFKTDVNNLLFQSHGTVKSRKRRDTTTNGVATPNLILNLSFANITDLMNVNFNESVASLNLSHNFLSTFNSSKFENLTVLDLSFNRFSREFHLDNDDSSLMLLARLDLSSNSITSFRCGSACRSLQTLNLSRNALTKVSIDNLTSLQYLDLSANLLAAIEPTLLRNKSNLSDLLLACNRISVINKDLLNQLGELRRLDLSHNDISDIENDALNELSNLQILDLSFNRIHIVTLQTLQNIPLLNRLSLGGNLMLRNALRAFAVSWSIMELDYSHVGLCQVPDSLAQSVRILNLYGNFLNVSIKLHFAKRRRK
jgi:Leucine-rich repeat (LRR) protein